MASLRANVLANYGGQVVAAVVGYATVPFYLRYLGHEGYGVAGLLLVLQSSLAVLDLGLGLAATREIGRLSSRASGHREMGHLLRTLEVVYFATAFVIVIGLAVGGGSISSHWIKAKSLGPETLQTCLLAAAVTIGLRWPIALYSGFLRGRERQVQLNVIGSAIALGRAVVAVGVLAFVSRGVVAFYVVQVGAAALELGLMATAAWASIRGVALGRPQFQKALLARVWGFSIRLALISGCAMLLKQVDRWAVSVLLPIDQLGYYTNALLLGMGIARIFAPVQGAVFPRLAREWASGQVVRLSETFHSACQCVMALAAPVAASLAALSGDALRLWLRTGDPDGIAAAAGAEPLTITALAMLFNSAMSIPNSLQIAAGQTALPTWTNSVGAIVLVPMSFLAVRHWGLAGAAYAWLVFNVLYYAIVPHLLFKRILPGHVTRWYLRDTLPFIGAGLALAASLRIIGHRVEDPVLKVGLIGAMLALYALVTWLVLPEFRRLASRLVSLRPRRSGAGI